MNPEMKNQQDLNYDPVPQMLGTNNNNLPISNQINVTPEDLMACTESLRTIETFVRCSYCSEMGPTSVARSLSIINIIFCYFCPCCWSCSKINNIKDFNCFDSEHSCRKCNSKIGKIIAC